MPRRNQHLIDLYRSGKIDPGECTDCGQHNWQPGYDRGDDPHYLGLQCRDCGNIIGCHSYDVAPDAWLDHHSTRDDLNAVFVGRTVAVADSDKLILDDGTELLIVVAEPSCCSGYDITELNGCDNIITGANIVHTEGIDPDRTDPHTYQLFVYSGHKKINLLTVDGDDGSGQYGTGFVIYVQAPKRCQHGGN